MLFPIPPVLIVRVRHQGADQPSNTQEAKRDLGAVIRKGGGAVIIATLAVVAGVAAARSTAWAAGIGAGSAVLVALLTVVMVVRHPRI